MQRTSVHFWLFGAAGCWHLIVKRDRPHARALLRLLSGVLLPCCAQVRLILVLHLMSSCAAGRSVLPRQVVV